MKKAAKWCFFAWTAFCLVGVGMAVWHGGVEFRSAMDNDGRELAQLEIVFGAVKWLGIWLVLAVPMWLVRVPSRDKSIHGQS